MWLRKVSKVMNQSESICWSADQSEIALQYNFETKLMKYRIYGVLFGIWNFAAGSKLAAVRSTGGTMPFSRSKMDGLESGNDLKMTCEWPFMTIPWYWRRNASHFSWYFSLYWFLIWLVRIWANRKLAVISKPSLVLFHRKHPIAKDPSNNQKAWKQFCLIPVFNFWHNWFGALDQSDITVFPLEPMRSFAKNYHFENAPKATDIK